MKSDQKNGPSNAAEDLSPDQDMSVTLKRFARPQLRIFSRSFFNLPRLQLSCQFDISASRIVDRRH